MGGAGRPGAGAADDVDGNGCRGGMEEVRGRPAEGAWRSTTVFCCCSVAWKKLQNVHFPVVQIFFILVDIGCKYNLYSVYVSAQGM